MTPSARGTAVQSTCSSQAAIPLTADRTRLLRTPIASAGTTSGRSARAG